MKHKAMPRVLSLIIVAALLLQMLPMQVIAAQDNNVEATEAADPSIPITVVGEEIALRDEAEKHFRLSDGTYLAVTYGTPVHYMDNAGNWQDIDNRPVMTTDMEGAESYQIANADKSTSFSSALTDGIIFTTSVGDFSVSIQLLDTIQAIEDFNTAQMTADDNAELISSVTEEELQVFSRSAVAELEENIEVYSVNEDLEDWTISDLMPENLTSSLIYEDVFPGVDLRYETSGYNIKEEIIVRQPQNSYRYDFLLTMNGLTARLNDDGSVHLINEDGEEIYEIPAPYMYDGVGERSTAVAYALREVEDGIILTVVADSTWINDTSREFPVTIDPTFNLTVSTSNNGEDLNMYITFVEENSPTQTAQGTDTLYIGYGYNTKELRGYIHLNQLPSLPVGSIITQASLSFLMSGFSEGHAYKIPVGIYELEENTAPSDEISYRDWIRFMNWDNKPEIKYESVIDYNFVSNQTLGHRIDWDITELVKTWYYEKTENRTVAMTVNTQENGAGNNAVATFAAYGASNAPSLVVSYRNNLGIEPYYTYTTLGAGAAGAAYIADATGQLRIVNSILGYSSSINPYSLGIVYNSDYFASDAAADYQPMRNLGLNMSVGSGWRLSCVERIVPETISYTTYLKYYDGDGTIHYFLPYNNAFYDEDGLGLKIVSRGNYAYDMTDDHGNKWTFTNSYLTQFSDETGNQIFFQYSGNRLVAINQQNKGANPITIASFNYNADNYLTSVTDAASNTYNFHYSGSRLTSIARGDATLAQYGYSISENGGSINRINQLTDTESGYQLLFDYDTAGKVSSFWESAGGVTGAKVDISYPNYGQTLYRDYGLDHGEANDDILTYYLFDHAGHTANAYTTDNFGNILGATNAVYSGTGSIDKTNNRTLRTASIGIAGQQLLKNTSFESEGNWTFGNCRQTANSRTGEYAVSVTQDITSDPVQLTAQTYTFSAYVDTSAATGFSGRGIYLKVSGGGQTWEGIPVNYQTSQDNKWTRISVTFTASSTGAYTFSICNDGVSGSVYVDDVQLEAGEAPSNYNLLENGSLSLGSYGWTLSSAAQVTQGAIRITGSPNNAAANASQTVAINLPSTETYVLSGWVTADAVPDTANTAYDPAEDTNKQCGLRAEIRYTDGTEEFHYVPFNTDLSTKQFVSYTIVPNPKNYQGVAVVKTVKEIVITCAYESNANVAVFDNISLVREISQTMEYDANGNLKSVTTSGLDVDINTYSGGNLIKTVTGSQGVYKYTYDSTYKHRLMSVTRQNTESYPTEQLTQSMAYDTYGNVVSTTLAGSGGLTMSTSAQYGNNGNLLSSVTDATGATVSYQYGNANSITWGLPTAVTAPNGTITSTAYDLYGRVTQTSVADLATLLYNYSSGNLETITRTADGKTQIYSLEYDPFGKTRSICVGSHPHTTNCCQLASYEYMTGNGPLLKQTYGNGHEVSFTYDNLGRTKTVTHKNGPTLTYAYTGDGQVHSITETNGSSTTVYLYRYDSLGNLVGSEKLAGGSLVLRTHHSYDTDNRLSAQGWQIGSDSFSQTYNYGEWDGNLSSIVLSRNSSNITVNYTYDGLRRLASMNNGAFTRTYNYATTASGDATTCLSSFTHSGIQSQYTYEWDYSYGYDINGNITSATFGNRTNTYVYDANNQLIRENNDRLQYTQTWEYDAFGNITATGKYPYTTGELGDVEPTVSYGYTDSNWGDLLTSYNGQTIEYDEIGNPKFIRDAQGNVVESFTWTQGRQLASHTTNGVTWEYTYDADGLRTGRTDGTNTYQYIYAGDKLVRMIYNGEVVDISYAGSQPLSLTYDGATYYYVLNGQGDVIGLTNSSGKMVIGYTYGAYGVATGLVADPDLSYVLVQMNPLTYRGYVYDREIKFYYLQSRYYDPELGRFLNADALVSTGQGILGNNMFAYCGNNPINYADSEGTFWWPAIIPILVIPFLLTGCGNSEGGAPDDYVQENSIYQNCYSYAFGLPASAYPGMYSIPDDLPDDYMRIDIEDDENTYKYTPSEITEYVLRDMAALGISVRVVYSPSDRLEGEYIVAMKTSTNCVPGFNFADVHFARQLSNGMWADKQGMEPSRWNEMDGRAIVWDVLPGDGYYNTETVYFAVGGEK